MQRPTLQRPKVRLPLLLQQAYPPAAILVPIVSHSLPPTQDKNSVPPLLRPSTQLTVLCAVTVPEVQRTVERSTACASQGPPLAPR